MRYAALMLGALVAASGFGCAGGRRAEEAEPSPPPTRQEITDSLREARDAWFWKDPQAIVLAVEAAKGDMVALRDGDDLGLAAGLTLGVYRDMQRLATVRVVEVHDDHTVCEVTDGDAQAIRPGDVAVYRP